MKYGKSLLNFFLKSPCPLCHRQTSQEFCQDCASQLQQQTLAATNWLYQGQLPVFAWGEYGGMLKRAIASLKYENQPHLARPLGHLLAKSWLDSQLAKARPSPIVVPIPLHVSKQKQRGYNQAALLAQSFCQITGLRSQLLGLERTRATAAQVKMSAQHRAQNLAKAFAIGPEFCRYFPTSSVLLLDDVYTTGATALAAAQTLQQGGITVYGVVTVAVAFIGMRSEVLKDEGKKRYRVDPSLHPHCDIASCYYECNKISSSKPVIRSHSFACE